jgi:hypothetical protein
VTDRHPFLLALDAEMDERRRERDEMTAMKLLGALIAAARQAEDQGQDARADFTIYGLDVVVKARKTSKSH